MKEFKNFEKEQLFLKTVGGTMFDVCHRFYDLFLKNESDKIVASQKFSLLLCWDRQTDKTNMLSPIHSKETYLEKLDAIKDTINTILGNLIKEKFDVSDFYKKLWDEITRRTIFATDLDTVAAIIYLCNSDRIPYYKLDDGLKMENEDFVDIVRSNLEPFKKMIFILNVGFEQRTEIASLLLKVLDDVKDYKAKVVLFANLIGYCARRAVQIQEKSSNVTTSED